MQANDTNDKKPDPQVQQQQAVQPPQTVTGDKSDPKNRLVMMAFAFFAGPAGIARMYLGETSGSVRFWIFLPSILLSYVPFINFLALPALAVLQVWGLVDFFLLKNKVIDPQGVQMVSTNRDERIIRYLFIAYIVLIGLSVLLVIGVILFVIFVGFAGGFGSGFSGGYTPTPSYRY